MIMPRLASTARRWLQVAVVMLALSLLAACGEDGNGDAREGADPGTTSDTRVTIEDFSFEPTPLEVEAGTELTVTNRDQATHTLTADNDAFDTGNIAGNDTGSLTIDLEPGRYRYHCEIHPSMNGILIVS